MALTIPINLGQFWWRVFGIPFDLAHYFAGPFVGAGLCPCQKTESQMAPRFSETPASHGFVQPPTSYILTAKFGWTRDPPYVPGKIKYFYV